MIENRLDFHTLTNRTPSSLSPPSSSASRSVNSKKGRKSPVPKLLSEMELKSQNWGWIDWLWWTAFNGSIGKLLCVLVRLTSEQNLRFTIENILQNFYFYSWMPCYWRGQCQSTTTFPFTTSLVLASISILRQSFYFLCNLLPCASISILLWHWNLCNSNRRQINGKNSCL